MVESATETVAVTITFVGLPKVMGCVMEVAASSLYSEIVYLTIIDAEPVF